MVSRARTGTAREVRAFVKQHPHATAAEVIAGIGADERTVWRELARLVRIGGLVAEREGKPLRYVPGADPWAKTIKPKPPKVTQRFQLREPLAERPQAVKKPEVRAQTVEDFLAHGGQVEKLPVYWDEHPSRYPQVRGRTG